MFFVQQIGCIGGAYVLYDTFSFKLTLPPVNRKLEFCICFRCDGKEFWDNNDVSAHIFNDKKKSAYHIAFLFFCFRVKITQYSNVQQISLIPPKYLKN